MALSLSKSDNKNEEYIFISKEIYNSIIKFKSVKNEKKDVEKFIINQLKNNPDKRKI